MLFEAPPPFGGMRKVNEMLPVAWLVYLRSDYTMVTSLQFVEVARLIDIIPAQAALSWLRQRGAVVLPMSARPDRIEESIQ
jgi:diketogulonate reductase-like aldo/keto reductase